MQHLLLLAEQRQTELIPKWLACFYSQQGTGNGFSLTHLSLWPGGVK